LGRLVRPIECASGGKSRCFGYEIGARQFFEREGNWQRIDGGKIDFGPGYRVYFGKDGDRLVILLGGGTKHRQQNDIRTAQMRWLDYKERKK
jgi:putative addiction module killer protein